MKPGDFDDISVSKMLLTEMPLLKVWDCGMNEFRG